MAYTNTLMPSLQLVAQFLQNKAKKKVYRGIAQGLNEKIQNVDTIQKLSTVMQDSMKNIYGEDYLDPQEQAQLVGIAGQYEQAQQAKLGEDKRLTDAEQLYQSALTSKMGEEYNVGGKITDVKTIDAQLASIQDSELKYKMLENLTRDKVLEQSTLGIGESGKDFYETRSKVSREGKVFKSEKIPIIKTSNNYWQDADDSGEYTKGEEVNAEIAGQISKYHEGERAYDRQLAKSEASQRRSYDYSIKKMDEKEERDKRKVFEEAVRGGKIITAYGMDGKPMYVRQKLKTTNLQGGAVTEKDFYDANVGYTFIDPKTNKEIVEDLYPTQERVYDAKVRKGNDISRLQAWYKKSKLFWGNTDLHNYFEDYGNSAVLKFLESEEDFASLNQSTIGNLMQSTTTFFWDELRKRYDKIEKEGNIEEEDKEIFELLKEHFPTWREPETEAKDLMESKADSTTNVTVKKK